MNEERARVLIIDDEPNIRKLVAGVLADEGIGSAGAASAEEALELLEPEEFELVLLDIHLPGLGGIEFLRAQAGKGILPPVIIMSGHGSIPLAIEATRLGAVDFIEKPVTAERLLLSVRNSLRLTDLQNENRELRRASRGSHPLVGRSPEMKSLQAAIDKAAPTEARVLITGENGTGKELVARAVHEGSRRKDRPFVKVNCAAIPSELLESELFGHVKGAFTGAIATRKGKFELAQTGTLLLDEIGDMNAATQAKLLRVLEENEMERVGGERTIKLDVRVLASTNQDLPKRIEEKAFREDLYYRIKVVPIEVPPLRTRRSDIRDLVEYYLSHFGSQHARRPMTISEDAIARLEGYDWPGNVRELRNLIERLTIMVEGSEIESNHLDNLLPGPATSSEKPALASGQNLNQALEDYERSLIRAALGEAGGNVAEASRRLGLDRANLHRKMKRLGIDRPEGT